MNILSEYIASIPARIRELEDQIKPLGNTLFVGPKGGEHTEKLKADLQSAVEGYRRILAQYESESPDA